MRKLCCRGIENGAVKRLGRRRLSTSRRSGQLIRNIRCLRGDDIEAVIRDFASAKSRIMRVVMMRRHSNRKRILNPF